MKLQGGLLQKVLFVFSLQDVLKQTKLVDALTESLLDAGSIPAASINNEHFMKKKISVLFFVLFNLYIFSLSINIRSFDHKDFTRIVFEGDTGFEFKISPSKTGIEIKLDKKVNTNNQITVIKDSVLIDRVLHKLEKNRSVFNVRLKSRYRIKRNFVLERPFRVVLDLVKSQEKDTEEKKSVNQVEEKPLEKSFKPKETKGKLTIETICIDPGHGGSDLGAIGKTKLLEKDITLKVSQKLKNIIESKLGLRVIMTRNKDSEVSLNSRVSVANNQKAQMFVSIHVNSSFRRAARGPETYFVSLKATDQESFELAQKENKSFEEIDKMANNSELKMILWNMAQTEYIKESSKLAEFIQAELNVLMHTRNRGVKQAPFRVLMRAAMPAILIEIAFISNPTEERKLKDDSFLERTAYSIYNGISKYIYYHNNIYKK